MVGVKIRVRVLFCFYFDLCYSKLPVLRLRNTIYRKTSDRSRVSDRHRAPHTGRGSDSLVPIEAGPQLQAGSCIQAGGGGVKVWLVVKVWFNNLQLFPLVTEIEFTLIPGTIVVSYFCLTILKTSIVSHRDLLYFSAGIVSGDPYKNIS